MHYAYIELIPLCCLLGYAAKLGGILGVDIRLLKFWRIAWEPLPPYLEHHPEVGEELPFEVRAIVTHHRTGNSLIGAQVAINALLSACCKSPLLNG